MDEKMDEKFRTKKWTKNRMIFLKNNSQWSQKYQHLNYISKAVKNMCISSVFLCQIFSDRP